LLYWKAATQKSDERREEAERQDRVKTRGKGGRDSTGKNRKRTEGKCKEKKGTEG